MMFLHFPDYQYFFFTSLGMSTELNQKISLPTLNLPHYEPKLQQIDGKLFIFDLLRKKYLILTPEEWVRQHLINLLIHHLEYPKGLLALEKGLKYNQLNKRTDIVVFDRESKPYLLIECKSPSIKITKKTLNQIMTYNAKLNCPHLALSNGQTHIFMEFSDQEAKFVQRDSLPIPPK